MNLPWTHAGLPTLSLPSGFSAHGLPLGTQFIGRFGDDERLLAWGAGLERALDSGGAASRPEARAALGQVDALRARRRATVDQAYRPRSLSAAVKQLPEAGWVLISVPGRHAAEVAREAVDQHR